jgi:iron complex transport system ATP-binding protein
MKALEAVAVSLELGGRPVLIDTTVRVEAGRVAGLLGPNGAGKSTLLRSLGGLEPSTSGERTLDGQSDVTVNRREWARRVAYLPQATETSWPITVRELVALGRLPHHRGPWGAASDRDRAVVEQAMRQADVGHLADRPSDALSGGERARVMLARALATEPSYMLADEPVAGLDPAHQLQVMELLRARAKRGMGILVVLHDLTLACRYCDQVILLDSGRVRAAGRPTEVLEAGRLARIFGVRVVALETPDGPVRVPVARVEGGPS